MRLADLDPHWLGYVSATVGVTFLCPHCRETRLAVMFWPPIDPANLFANAVFVNDLREMRKWQRTGDTFETLTLAPSIDTSRHGHWHGFIQNGEVTP